MNFKWQNINDLETFIVSQDSTRSIPYQEFIVTPKPELLDSSAGEKNSMQLWLCPSYLLRPENPESQRPVLRRHADLPGCGDTARVLSQMPKGETREADLAGRLSLLYQTILLLCRPTLPGFEYPGYRQGIASGLENSQVFGDAVYAGAASPSGNSRPQGDWNRRNISAQRAYVSDRSQ